MNKNTMTLDDKTYELPNDKMVRVLQKLTEVLLDEDGKERLASFNVGDDAMKPEEYKRWRAEEGQKYWTNAYTGGLSEFEELADAVDDFCYSVGDYFQTKEQAQAHRDYLQAMQTIRDSAKGFVPNWSDRTQVKYAIFYDHSRAMLCKGTWPAAQYPLPAFYPTGEAAEEALKDEEVRQAYLTVLGIKD